MNLIEEKINELQEETEESVNSIIEGSDEHLDMILSVTKPLYSISQKFEDFNEFLYSCINNFSDEEVRNSILPKLSGLNKSCLTLIGAIRTSYLYKDVRIALKNYTRQHAMLREIIHDLQNIRLAKDAELDDILKELSSL